MKEKKELQSTPSIWCNGRFRRMFAAHTAASFGDWFDAIAIQVLVAYRWEADPMMIALIPVVMALPGLLLGSIAGTLADRVHKARLMIVCDAAIALLTLAILAVPGPVWLLPLLGLRAAAGVFQMPSQQGLTRTVVTSDDLFRATSLNGLVNQASKVAGPLLGAMTLTVLSPPGMHYSQCIAASLFRPAAVAAARNRSGVGQRRPTSCCSRAARKVGCAYSV